MTLDGAQHASGRIMSEVTNDSRRQQTLPSNSSSSSPSRSSRSKSPRRYTLASHEYFSDLAIANPDDISLWKSAMEYKAETEGSKGRGEKGAPSATGTLTSAQILATPTSSTPKPKKELIAQVSDPDFQSTVLASYGITIEKESLTLSVYDHFALSKLPTYSIEHFNAYKEKFDFNIWLRPDNENAKRIQEEFCAMSDYHCNEAEFAAYVLQEVLLNERRYPKILEPSEALMAPVRTLQLKQEPTPGSTWEAPTRVTLSEKQYNWDMRPDCAYYVSLRAFPPDLRFNIKDFVSVVQNRAFCPYLTIEFQKYLEAHQTATNRVAVASAIALYNRWHLKHKALQRLGLAKIWHKDQSGQLRHYSIAFSGAEWELCCTIPKTYDVWSGCIMFQMRSGDCCYANSVMLLLSILNDIHYWGLTVHGESCRADICTVIKGDAGRVFQLSETIEGLEIGNA